MCAASYIDCITSFPVNECTPKAPFKWEDNSFETCIKSQTEYNCPTGYTKCGFMNYRVRDDRRDMCTKFQKKKVFNQSIIKMDFVKKKILDFLIWS